MTLYNQSQVNLLILAIDARMLQDLPECVDPKVGDEPAKAICVVQNAAEAMRLIYQHQPLGLLVWVNGEQLTATVLLIEALHHRRPELPLLAITPEHDQRVERSVRAAGAGYYFEVDGEADPPFLRQTLEALGLFPARASPNTGPPARAGPSRIRGRPPAVFRSP